MRLLTALKKAASSPEMDLNNQYIIDDEVYKSNS